MTDKDLKERKVLKRLFPGSQLLICRFHVLKSFKREITCEKLGISREERNLSLEFLQKLSYAASDEEYNKIYDDLRSRTPPCVLSYFDKNWHSIRHEWVIGISGGKGSLFKSTNRLESFNQKLKSVITRFSSLEQFLEQLYILPEE